MASLIGIIGSLRKESVNGLVARTAESALDRLAVFDVADLPLYHGDEEAAGPPARVRELHEAVAGADGIVFFSPEYNSSFPAVTKNVIDWLSRPPRSYEGRAVTMVTASPGRRAGAGVREHFAAVMAHQPVRVYDTLGIGTYGERLTPDGRLDEETVAELTEFIGAFASFAAAAPD